MVKTSPSSVSGTAAGPAVAPGATLDPVDQGPSAGNASTPRTEQKKEQKGPMSLRTKIGFLLVIAALIVLVCIVFDKKADRQVASPATQEARPKKSVAKSQLLEPSPEPATQTPPRSLAEMFVEEDAPVLKKELHRARAELAELREQVRKITSTERSAGKPSDVAATQPAAIIQGKRNLEQEMDDQKEGLSKVDNGIAKQLVPDAKREISNLWDRIQESEKVADQKFVHKAEASTRTQPTTSPQSTALPTASKASANGSRPSQKDGWSITYVPVGTESRKYSQQEYWNNKVRWNGHEGINFMGEKADGTWVLLEAPVSKSKMVSAGILFLKLVPQTREIEVYEAPLPPYSL